MIDRFTEGYIEAALWSSTDDEGEPLDEDYGIDDIAPSTFSDMVIDCDDFQESNDELLDDAYGDGISPSKAGHDFWLTRNGHGAGFWDGDYPDDGKELTANSKAYGGIDLYVGDDGLIYGT